MSQSKMTDVLLEEWVGKLKEAGQEHLFPKGASPDDTARLVKQIVEIDKDCHLGIIKYLERAKCLLAAARADKNPYEGYEPVEPAGQKLTLGSDEFAQMEEIGAQQIALTCFVLVAGGRGERLGWPGIKVELPTQTCTNACFMELYAQHIIALQLYAGSQLHREIRLPLAIMTSGDTHKSTVELLESGNYFGLDPDQVSIVQQGQVPSLQDSQARMATRTDDPFQVETKPHGHGDVHSLLQKAQLPKTWSERGFRWVVFFQDTNSLVFRAVLPLLGVSASSNFVMNSLTIPRKTGEAIGAICKLKKENGESLTINVEYNQLDALLKSSSAALEDGSGNSVFPGNTNVFVLHIPRYAEVLQHAEGIIPEFVNPKYTDASRTQFKASTRLECMMQDFPKLLDPKSDCVGYTEMERWLCFSTVKNNVTDAAAKIKENLSSESAFSGESDHYYACARLLRMAATAAGAHPLSIPDPIPASFAGVDYQLGPRVVLQPQFGVSFQQLKERLDGCKGKPLTMTTESVLILDGCVKLQGLTLNGALLASADLDQTLKIRDLNVNNLGWEWVPYSPKLADNECDFNAIRGFAVTRHAQTELHGECFGLNGSE